MRSQVFFLATLFSNICTFHAILYNSCSYLEFPVGYIWEKDGVLQRLSVPFIHCKNLISVKCNNQIQLYVWWLYDESLVKEYVLCQVLYGIFFYSMPFTASYCILISSLSKDIFAKKHAGVNQSHVKSWNVKPDAKTKHRNILKEGVQLRKWGKVPSYRNLLGSGTVILKRKSEAKMGKQRQGV